MKKMWVFIIATYAVAIQFLGSILIIALYWSSLPPLIPLWYSKPWGQDRLTSPVFIFIIPITGVVIYLINCWIVRFLHTIHPIYARVLLLSSFAISCLCLLIVTGIIRLVT